MVKTLADMLARLPGEPNDFDDPEGQQLAYGWLPWFVWRAGLTQNAQLLAPLQELQRHVGAPVREVQALGQVPGPGDPAVLVRAVGDAGGDAGGGSPRAGATKPTASKTSNRFAVAGPLALSPDLVDALDQGE